MRTEVRLNFEDLETESLHVDPETPGNVELKLLPDRPAGFWKRQFAQEPTRKQKIFDWAYGVVVPLICVAADPGVFRSFSGGSGVLGEMRPFAYLLSAVSILAMAAWLLWGARLKWAAAPLAGLFFVGGGISFAVGLFLFPASFIGLFFLIGALGFTPLFSSVVFLRNGVRAYRAAISILENQLVWQVTFLAAVFSFVIPFVVNMEMWKLVDELVKGDVITIQSQSLKLKILAPLLDPGPIARSYFDSPEDEDSPRMRMLAEVYEDLSGDDIKTWPRFEF
jgi:hypothetical protein